MEVPADRNHDGPSPAVGSVNDVPNTTAADSQKDGDNEMIYYMDEPHAPGN
jgi:hypothetical protein